MDRNGEVREEKGEEGVEKDRILRIFRRCRRTKVFTITEGVAGLPAGSWVAGDFITKAAITKLFPKKESVTVYTKGRIAQLQSQESYFTCLWDECQNVLGHLP